MFSQPQWNPSTNSYTIKINSPQDFSYIEVRDKSSGHEKAVDVTNDRFQLIVNNLANSVYEHGNSWFASPIKPNIFLKKAKHIIDPPIYSNLPGNQIEFTWNPVSFEITTRNFEIKWKLLFANTITTIPSNFIDISEELEPRTIVIQQNEIIENAEIPFDNSDQSFHPISSRAAGMLLKQKVRKAKLKAAIATMNAERMAEKYFRRYGVQTDLDSDSDLSFDSDEEESDSEHVNKLSCKYIKLSTTEE
jgi:hypothetical protein